MPKQRTSSHLPSLNQPLPTKTNILRITLTLGLVSLFLVCWPFSQDAHSQSHQEWLASAYQLFQKGRLPEALQRLEQAEQALGPHPAFYYYKGLIYQALRQADKALGAYRQAEPALDASYQPWLLNNMGNLFYQKGRYRAAVRYYARALRQAPDYQRARYNLELALRALQNPPPPPPPPRNRQSQPPPRTRNSKRPPPPRKNKKDRVVAPPKRRKWALPPANAFQLKAFDRFLPYSRVLKHHQLRAQQKPQ
ncbi:MAG: tetratricopeptide repeat protein [Myxococcales bacterium]|nr:tetratricopeptide repeat protein [Myxococcales bacterium]